MQALATVTQDLRGARRDPGFQEALARLARTGMAVSAGLGIIAVLLFVAIHAVFLDKALGWQYSDGVLPMWDKTILVGLCAVALVTARHLSLGGARLLTAGIAVACALASVADDIVGGSAAFSSVFLTIIFLLAVVCVPYRPVHTVALGVAMASALYLAIELVPALAAVPEVSHNVGHYVYLTIVTILLAGVSGMFDVIRYGQYRAQRDLGEEQLLTQSLLAKVETLFGQQVSAEVASEMLASETELESKACFVTVMFLDIRDFTLFAESREPAEVARFQNIVFGELIEIVRAHGGVVLQILGDGLMAVFGAPVAYPDHADRAVRAGLAATDRIASLGAEGRIPEIRVGIGLHSGDVIAGNLGNKARKFYSLTGKTVIVAARVEPLNKKYGSQMLVTDSVWSHVSRNGYEAVEIGDVRLKGIRDPVPLYRLR